MNILPKTSIPRKSKLYFLSLGPSNSEKLKTEISSITPEKFIPLIRKRKKNFKSI